MFRGSYWMSRVGIRQETTTFIQRSVRYLGDLSLTADPRRPDRPEIRVEALVCTSGTKIILGECWTCVGC
eukprot:scaffold597_cov242-Prasinococcus_capsulatus_cf.AAC.11